MVTTNTQTVNIRPEVSMLSILKSVNYKAWYAVAEFVDNAIQSASASYDALSNLHKENYRLSVSIEIDPTPGQEKITIRDNAGGISLTDFPRAFRPASLPLDRSGLSEFGMGMKSAACWFANYWTVRTTAIGESVERTVTFDIQRIVDQKIEEIPVRERPISADAHYTEITLTRLNQLPQKKTVAKIKSHLASMYRVFLRAGILELSYNNQPVTFDDPKILVAPYYKSASEPPIQWKKDIFCEIAPGMQITGFAAILEEGSTTNAGFALLRRNRVILGSDDEGYRPPEIFGSSNTFVYQRLFGELHLEGFAVSHTKDGIQWSHHEDQILQTIKKALNAPPIQLLDQAKGYRARGKDDFTNGQSLKPKSNAVAMPPTPKPFVPPQSLGTGNSIFSGAMPQTTQPPLASPFATNGDRAEVTIPPPSRNFEPHILQTLLNGEVWKIRVELSNDESIGDWLSIQGRSDENRELDIRLALAHPFMSDFSQVNDFCLDPIIHLAAVMAIAEIGAQNVGIQKAGTFRRFVNQVLRDGFIEG